MTLIADSITLQKENDFTFEDNGGCINSIRHIRPGEVWPESDIRIRKESLLERGRDWLVVDNLIVHESIKQGKADRDKYLQNYQQSLINLSRSGIKVVCFNFMPVFYKVRTHYTTSFPDKHVFSLFDMVAFMAFDLFILERKEAVYQYSSFQRHSAKCYFQKLDDSQKCMLQENVLRSVQSDMQTTLEEFMFKIQEYRTLSDGQLSTNLGWFENQVKPLADSLRIKLHLNSDNPCAKLLGLPAVT